MLGRDLTVVLRQVAIDEGRDRCQILRHAPVALGGIACRAAVAGADRIDEDEIAEVQPAVGIAHQLAGSRWYLTIGPEIDDPRSQRTKMEIGRARPWSAIEDESDRPALARRIVAR